MGDSLFDQTEVFKYLEASSEIPPDVVFKIYTSKEDMLGRETPLGEVSAHKNIIMMVSPVFRRKLLENEDMFTEVIVVPDTTLAAFQAMINMVYQKQTVTTIFRRLGLRDMFQTLSLAQRYDITMMQETMVEHFSRMVITQENLLETAVVAKEYEHLGVASETVFNNCAKLLLETKRTVRSLLQFGKDHVQSPYAGVALKLMSKMADLKDQETVHNNR